MGKGLNETANGDIQGLVLHGGEDGLSELDISGKLVITIMTAGRIRLEKDGEEVISYFTVMAGFTFLPDNEMYDKVIFENASTATWTLK